MDIANVKIEPESTICTICFKSQEEAETHSLGDTGRICRLLLAHSPINLMDSYAENLKACEQCVTTLKIISKLRDKIVQKQTLDIAYEVVSKNARATGVRNEKLCSVCFKQKSGLSSFESLGGLLNIFFQDTTVKIPEESLNRMKCCNKCRKIFTHIAEFRDCLVRNLQSLAEALQNKESSLPLPVEIKIEEPFIEESVKVEDKEVRNKDIDFQEDVIESDFKELVQPDYQRFKTPDYQAIQAASWEIQYIEEPDIPDNKKPDIQDTENPDIQDTENPDIGNTENPDIRDTEDPDIQYTEDLDIEDTENPDVQDTDHHYQDIQNADCEDPDFQDTKDPDYIDTDDPDFEEKELDGIKTCTKKKSASFKKGNNNILNIPCEICGIVLKNIRSYKRHQRHMHAPESLQVKCYDCNQIFKHPVALKYHQKYTLNHAAKNFECHLCEKLFFKQIELDGHIEFVHEGRGEMCNLCGKICQPPYGLKKHIRTRHRNNIGAKTNRKAKTVIPTDRRQCEECGVVLKHLSSFQKHMRDFHHPDSETAFCEECGKSFQSIGLLKRHQQNSSTHAKKHKCEKCDKTFISKRILEGHIQYVHENKGHLCPLCKKVCPPPYGLTKHMRRVHYLPNLKKQNAESSVNNS